MATKPVDLLPPAVDTGTAAPVRKLNSQVLQQLGNSLNQLFNQYKSDRRLSELKWMRNLRQYLGQYDPEIEREIGSRSRAYPRVTRVKCISVLSRIMNLMYPGNERNWSLTASPSPQMDPKDVMQAVQAMVAKNQQAGIQEPPSDGLIMDAVQALADERAQALSLLIDDQLQEIGGDQTLDVIALDRKVADSAIKYGIGYLEGPYVRKEQQSGWAATEEGLKPYTRTLYKPQFDFSSVWDTYIDMSSRHDIPGDGYFLRKVLGKKELRKLADRHDFFAEQIKDYIRQNPGGNYKPLEFESELRAMGTRAHINDQRRQDVQGNKYEVIVWKGPVAASQLTQLGADVPDKYAADDVDAEVWLIDSVVIKADINQWRKLGIDDVKTLHAFVFDEDDTSPIGNGLPNVMRDSQMSIAAATRMLLDNASVTCGPNLELNLSLLRTDQDLESVSAYKMWYRDDTDPLSAQYPAVRNVSIDGHLDDLQKMIEMFMRFADMETFVGPATGGDLEKAPSEPMRTAAGASMLRSDAALPFKDIIRNFDSYKQSQILSLVQFNKKFNPDFAPEGDYDVIARGATSLIAKEVRGMQIDMLSQTLTPEERDWIKEDAFIRQKFAVRDMDDMMVSKDQAMRNRAERMASMSQMNELQQQLMQAQIRETLASALKDISQSQKNSAAADAQTTNAALDILEHGLNANENDQSQGPSGTAGK
jgi:hypothetical protein